MQRSKKITALAVMIGVTLVAGVAFAKWTADGSGTGTAKSLTAQTVTFTGATPTADLYPGGPAGAVYFSASNTNPYTVVFSKITGLSVVSDDTANCPNANVSVPAASVAAPITLGTNVTLAPGASTFSIPSLVTLAGTAPDGCQTKTFTVTATLLGIQQ